MTLSWGLIVGLVVGVAETDEPRPASGSNVGRLLAEIQGKSDRAIAEWVKANEPIAGQPEPTPAEREQRDDAARERFIATIRPELNRLLAEAEAAPVDPSSIAALDFVARDARGWDTDEATRALRLLTRDHTRAEGISLATRTAFAYEDRPEADRLCRVVLAENPSRVERGRACQDLAFALLYHAQRVRSVRAGTSSTALPACLVDADPEVLQAEAERLYERCVAEFADVPVVGYGAGKTVGDFARGVLTDLRVLRVGAVAPEIVGETIDGQPLRLSDYRGRAVVLVFAGEWCGPCRAQAAAYRDLLRPESQAKHPCVVLEVNTDATRDPVRQAVAAGEITWPCWFDGGVTGPITMAWGVESFPTVHILDADGVIRAKDVRRAKLAEAVAAAQGLGKIEGLKP